MNSNKQNSNNFLLGVSSNKNNSLQKANNNGSYNEGRNTYSNAYSPLETKKIVFGIIDKLEKDIVELNNKINSLNKEKIELKNLSNKEVQTLKEVIKKLYMILSSFYNYKSSNLSKNDRISLLHKLKNTIEENESFMKITNKIVRNDKTFNTELNNTLRHNNMTLVNESIHKNNESSNNESSNNGLPNNASLSNIIASKNSQAKEELENSSRMNDNAFLKREEAINNGVEIPENNSNSSIQASNNGVLNLNNPNSLIQASNNGVRNVNNPNGLMQASNNGVRNVNNPNGSVQASNNSVRNLNNPNGYEQVSTNSIVKELSNNKNIYKSENKELTQSKKIPLITKIEEHKINQEKANQNFNEYKKFL